MAYGIEHVLYLGGITLQSNRCLMNQVRSSLVLKDDWLFVGMRYFLYTGVYKFME